MVSRNKGRRSRPSGSPPLRIVQFTSICAYPALVPKASPRESQSPTLPVKIPTNRPTINPTDKCGITFLSRELFDFFMA